MRRDDRRPAPAPPPRFDFKKFHRAKAVAFKRALEEQGNRRTGEPLSKATILTTLAHLKAFFFWLAGQSVYKSKLQYGDADFFNMSLKDTAIAKAVRPQRVPTLDELHRALAAMPTETPFDRRNQAVFAFTMLSAARDGAIASLRLKHLNLGEGMVLHDAREVRVKFSKTFPTYLLPFDDIRRILDRWVAFLGDELAFGPDDPLFPPTRMGLRPDGTLGPVGFERTCWK